MLRPVSSRRPAGQHGVGLVELLVAVVIATLGLLSLAGLQAFSLRYAKLSQYRAIATQLANDITERIRANRVDNAANGSVAYDFRQSFADQQPGRPHAPATSSQACTAQTSPACTQAQMAAADLATWRLSVRDLLPDGSVYLAPDAATTAQAAPGISLWLAWSDPADVAGGGRASGECPAGLALADTNTKVRCLFFRVLP